MTSTEWIELLHLIPEAEHTRLVVVLQNGTELCVDTLHRFEPNYVVLRGRTGGTIDEARGFFVPYDQMLCLRIDRVVKLEELEEFLGSAPETHIGTLPVAETPLTPKSEQPTPTVPTDPATASRLLLERIRAVRASSQVKFPSQM
jgi:hypothetical protein